MHVPQLLFAYLSPETFLPVTSLLATVVGVVLMFGKNAYRLVVHQIRSVFARNHAVDGSKVPHFRLKEIKQRQSTRQ